MSAGSFNTIHKLGMTVEYIYSFIDSKVSFSASLVSGGKDNATLFCMEMIM